MSFKLLLLFFVAACGVKGNPGPPASELLPSLLENYPDIQLEKPLEDQRRKQ